MAGTNRSRGLEGAERPGPAIILVEPQLGDNIGAAARAIAKTKANVVFSMAIFYRPPNSTHKHMIAPL